MKILEKKRDGFLQLAPPSQSNRTVLQIRPITKRKLALCQGRSIGYTSLILWSFMWFPAAALARVDTRAGESRLRRLEGQVHAGTYVKKYSRNELQQPEFSPAPQLEHQRLWAEVTGMLNRIRQGLGGDQQRKALDSLKTQQPDANRWGQSRALMTGSVETVPANLEAVSAFFSNESQRAATDSVRERVPVLNQLTSMNFNVDLGAGVQSLGQEQPAAKGNVRYGLIVRDILPDLGGVKRASTTTTPEEIAHAGRARVQWGIGPLQEHEERPIMTDPSLDTQGRRSFSGILIPSPKFKGSARAESFNVGGSGRGPLPAWRLDLTQEDQLYNLTYRTQRTPQAGNMEHAVKVPLVGSLSVGQRYSQTFSRLETTASGVLLDRRLPQVILHYLHLEERYKAEVETLVNGSRVGASARSRVRGVTDRPDEATEAYSVTFSKDF